MALGHPQGRESARAGLWHGMLWSIGIKLWNKSRPRLHLCIVFTLPQPLSSREGRSGRPTVGW